jgi:hypothetical protein
MLEDAMNQMKKWIAVGLLLVCARPAVHAAALTRQPGHGGDFGIGAILGAPTGLSAKYWLSETSAIDGALAWHFGDDDRFQIHADHLWHFYPDSLRVPNGKLPFYFGAGLRILAGDHSEAGIRIPFGLSYLASAVPVEAFAELAPVVEFAPDTEGSLEGGIGVRFYFR